MRRFITSVFSFVAALFAGTATIASLPIDPPPRPTYRTLIRRPNPIFHTEEYRYVWLIVLGILLFHLRNGGDLELPDPNLPPIHGFQAQELPIGDLHNENLQFVLVDEDLLQPGFNAQQIVVYDDDQVLDPEPIAFAYPVDADDALGHNEDHNVNAELIVIPDDEPDPIIIPEDDPDVIHIVDDDEVEDDDGDEADAIEIIDDDQLEGDDGAVDVADDDDVHDDGDPLYYAEDDDESDYDPYDFPDDPTDLDYNPDDDSDEEREDDH